MPRLLLTVIITLSAALASAADANLLIEAESFAERGGWKLDTQFIETMGSPYLLAHGLGRPVKDATTTVTFASTGVYRVWVRTKDWVARWNAPGHPGRFQLLVNGKPLQTTFGTKSAAWFWHDGGTVRITQRDVSVSLRDLTGFDGRCDAILFTKDPDFQPPNDSRILPDWRKRMLGLPDEPKDAGNFDLVVIGGGYSGMGTAISAARMGIKVALIQNRPVLGGNGSSEVRVWAMGLVRRGLFPHIGEIVAEFTDHARKSPGRKQEFGDDKKERIVRAEQNISLFLNHHAYKVETDGKRIAAVYAFDTRTSEHKRFRATLFADCTGHGTIGFLAGADWDMEPKGRMGMSNMWRWDEGDNPVEFPNTSWALDLDLGDFPYPRDHHGQWFWESGFDRDPIREPEAIRDWNLRAVYGAFNAMKNRGGRERHRGAVLTWVAFIGGPRESRRLLGDVILTQKDVVTKRRFPDGCVPSTWSIDLHYPKQRYMNKYPDNPFIAIAKHDRRVDRKFGYPIPYRCFYSRNISNLFMAGRCISVTHEALGTVRVMKTCGMMGEVVGKAAAVCVQNKCTPREVYDTHLAALKALLRLPGSARRATLADPIIFSKITSAAPVRYEGGGIDPMTLGGIVVDDRQAQLSGPWRPSGSGGLKGHVGDRYLYAPPSARAKARFEFRVPKDGRYEVRVSYGHHPNRSTRTRIIVYSADGENPGQINQKRKAPLENGFISLGVFRFDQKTPGAVVISTNGADGIVHVDAVQVLPSE